MDEPGEARPDARSPELPEGWTDDLRVAVAPDRTLDQLVDFLFDAEHQSRGRADVLTTLTEDFALSFDEARLALDRFSGGRARARSGSEHNRPDELKDPIAHIAFERARGVAAPPPPVTRSDSWRQLRGIVSAGDVDRAIGFATSREIADGCSPAEREAATLWADAAQASAKGTTPATCTAAALLLLELIASQRQAGVQAAVMSNTLLQLGSSLTVVGQSRIEELGNRAYAKAGTPLWFDAIRLSQAAYELSRLFAEAGDPDNQARALEIRRRMTTRMLGHCPDRVGVVMLDSARCELRLGERERAASMCDAVIHDFPRLVIPAPETEAESLLDEEERALEQLIAAIDLRRELGGADEERLAELRARCSSLLAAGDHP